MSLPIAKVTIRRFAAIEELSFEPGAITEFRGVNGAGKSSAVNAVMAALRGCAGKYVRDGEANAKILVELTDETTINRRIVREGSQPRVRIKPAGAPAISSPAAWLEERVDELANVMDFLTVAPEKRLRWLLEATPLKLSEAELAEVCAGTIDEPSLRAAAQQHALIAIDAIRTRLSEARRDANVAGKAKRTSMAQLQLSLPVEDGEDSDWAVVEAELAAQVGSIDMSLTGAIRAAEKARDEEIRAATLAKSNARREISADIERKIEVLRAEERTRLIGADTESETRKAAAVRLCLEETDRVKSATAGEREGLAESLATARAKREEAGRIANTRAIVDGLEREAQGLEANWLRYQTALDRVQALNAGLLARMPIQGLETREGNLCRGNIPFELLNTAQCMDIAMELAELRAAQIGVVCLDGIQNLDPANQAALYERMAASGLQWFVTRITAEPTLVVETVAA